MLVCTRRRQPFWRRVIVAIAAIAVLLIPSAWVGAAEPAAHPLPTKVLQEKGLTKAKGGGPLTSWTVPDDAKTVAALEAFRKAVADEKAAQKSVKIDSSRIGKEREELANAEKDYATLDGYVKKPDTIPPNIQRRFRSEQEMKQALVDQYNGDIETINKLRPKLNSGAVGGMVASLKKEIEDWMTVRAAVAAGYPAAKEQLDGLADKYKALGEDADVVAALKTLGKRNRLGSPEFLEDQKLLADVEKRVLGDEVPFYREQVFDFVSAVVNGKASVLLRIDPNPQSANWIPADVLDKAGVAIPASAQTVTLNFSSPKRAIQCRLVQIPALDLGKYTLRDLKFLAMPPDAKDLGTQLMAKELNDYDLTPDRDTWLLKIVPKPKEDKPDTETKAPADAPAPVDSK
jgi:hypothetical protein